ncbi:nitroreductase family protein [Mesobacillus subterraneus]|uniref:nitroreductase family protein n=1 Tax=Mesobacillus subterraneus TaxID=285983 RepID=UPI00203B5EB6|nr:nitroreductase family protein [Mesobacillus subterraneus]MCM3574405.1 nitroreductase family protein [Mesobacillus subterraneus]
MGKTLELIKTRRSIREWEATTIDRAILESLVTAAMWAPSSCNRQSTKFFFVSDMKDKQLLEEVSTGGKGFAHLAPVIAILLSDLSIYNLPYERNLSYIDAALAAQNFMLQAADLGLGTCYLNWALPQPEDDIILYNHFNLPEHMVIVGLIPLGYPKKDKEVPVSERKPLEEFVLKW